MFFSLNPEKSVNRSADGSSALRLESISQSNYNLIWLKIASKYNISLLRQSDKGLIFHKVANGRKASENFFL